jgi:hypothetical protein
MKTPILVRFIPRWSFDYITETYRIDREEERRKMKGEGRRSCLWRDIFLFARGELNSSTRV